MSTVPIWAHQRGVPGEEGQPCTGAMPDCTGVSGSEVTLSVVIPTRGRQELLRQVLQALARQTYPAHRFEVVVVVDGSEDGTTQMLNDLRLPYRLIPIWQKQSGPARARNVGVARASGEIVLFVDDDVIPAANFLEEHVRFHDDEKAVVIGRVSPDPGARRPGWSRWEEQMLDRHFKALAEGRRRVVGRHVYSGNFSVRKKHFVSVGGFDEAMRRAEDIDLGHRLEQLGLGFYFSPKADGIHCGHRSYDAWKKIPYQYGRLDVIMGRDKGYPDEMRRIFTTFHKRHLLVRLPVVACLDREGVSSAFLGLLRCITYCGDVAGLSRVTRYLYSEISNLLYWQGVSDELGGSKSFWLEILRVG